MINFYILFNSSRTAQTVRWMVTEEEFGQQHSAKILEDSYDKEYELGIMSALTYINSHESLFPKYLRYSLRSKSSGWDNQHMVCIAKNFSLEYLKHPLGSKAKIVFCSFIS